MSPRLIGLLSLAASPWLAAAAISALLVLCAAGSTIPQVGDVAPDLLWQWQSDHPAIAEIAGGLGLFDIFASRLFLWVVALFLLNLLACTAKTCLEQGLPPASPLTGRGARQWGFVVVHLALIFLTGSAWLDYACGGRGKFVVKERMWFPQPGLYLYYSSGLYSGMTVNEPPALPFSILFDRLSVEYQNWIVTRRDFAIQVQDRAGCSHPAVIAPNRPLEQDGYAVTMDEYGFAPHFIIKDGERTVESRPGLLSPFCLGKNAGEDIFHFPDDLCLKVQLFPDGTVVDEREMKVVNGGWQPKNPVFLFTLWQGDNLLGKTLLRYAPGTENRARIGKYTIGVSGIEYWCSFMISRNPAQLYVYLSMWLCLLGLVITYGRWIFAKESSDVNR